MNRAYKISRIRQDFFARASTLEIKYPSGEKINVSRIQLMLRYFDKKSISLINCIYKIWYISRHEEYSASIASQINIDARDNPRNFWRALKIISRLRTVYPGAIEVGRGPRRAILRKAL